jgi:hypothetical protein
MELNGVEEVADDPQLVENGVGDGTRTRDVRLGKTLLIRALSTLTFLGDHQKPRYLRD